MKKSVLVIEDDHKISAFVARGLVAAGFEVDECHDGEQALALLANKLYNVAILDLMLPKIDGWSILDSFKKTTPAPPIIVLSAKRSVSNRVECLAAGADDFLTKPFSLAELLARVQAVLRRSSPPNITPVISVSDLVLDVQKKRAERGGEAIDLQPREFALLEYLMRHVDQPVSKATILEHVWGYELRSTNQRCRCVGVAFAKQSRSWVRKGHDQNYQRSRICSYLLLADCGRQ